MSDFNFIDDLANYITDTYPVLPLWATLLSSTTLASALSRNIFFYNKYGHNRMNQWIAYFANSGDFKSTPIDEITVPLLDALGEENEHSFILPSIASSIEGMIKHFSENKSKNNWGGLVVRDELTTFFKESLNKDYLTDEMEIYSKMYDGILYPRETMRVTTKRTIPVYMNLVGATTPKYLYDQLPINFFFQGCGNRFLYVLDKRVTEHNYTDDDLFQHDYEAKKFTKESLPPELEPFLGCLREASQATFEILIDVEAEHESTKFRNEREALKKKILSQPINTFKAEYVSRDWQKSLKLAQLHCFSRDFQKEDYKKEGVLQILKDDIIWGQNIVKQCYEHFEQMVMDWSVYGDTKPQTLASDIKITIKYLNIIKSHGLISQARLALEVGNTQREKEFYPTLGFLISVGCIKQLKDTADLIRMKGLEWMKEQKINPKFKNPPTLYEYVMSL
jgi:hypothetical protein